MRQTGGSCWIVLVWFLLIGGTGLRANGIYIPEQAVLEMPRIPVQRALITYRDGTETLVLESSLTTQSRSVGWIVPLPSEPTKVELGDPDMLRMTAVSQQPKVVHDLSQYTGKPKLCLVAMAPLALALVLTRNPIRRPGFWVLAGVLFFLGTAYVVPQFTNAGLSASNEVAISAVHRLGDYDATVLRAATPEALDEWLGQRGLRRLDPPAKKVVAEYIAQKWCFVVSQLSGSAAEVATPRPLVMSFPAASCVFPMRLTQLAGNTTRVELYVASDKQAQAPGFGCVAADKYIWKPAPRESWEYSKYVAGQIELTIANPDVQELLWDGCIVTHLAADLTPAQMTTDVQVGFAPLVPHRETAYTARARWELIQIVGGWSIVALVAVTAVAFHGRRWPGKPGWTILIAILAAGVLVIAGISAFVPVSPVAATYRILDDYIYSRQQNLIWEAKRAVEDGVLDSDTPCDEVLPTLVRAGRFNERIMLNPVTGERMRYERTPGNLAMRIVGGKTYLCLYATDGGEYRVLLPPAPTTQPNPGTAPTMQ